MISDNKNLTENQMVAEILLFTNAGFETTGYSLATALFLLAKNPEVQQKLQCELLSMEPDERPKSKYLKCVINESMRLLPTGAFGGVRKAGRDFTFQDESGAKIVIPKNAVVVFPFYAQNRDPTIFVEPDLFIPERWETNYDKCNGLHSHFRMAFVIALGNLWPTQNCIVLFLKFWWSASLSWRKKVNWIIF